MRKTSSEVSKPKHRRPVLERLAHLPLTLALCMCSHLDRNKRKTR